MSTTAELLDFEARWPGHSGAKEEAIRTRLHVTPARYYQLLGRAARSIEGQQYDAVTAARVRRVGSSC